MLDYAPVVAEIVGVVSQRHFTRTLFLDSRVFDPIAVVNQAADTADTVVRFSMDAKATVKVGPFARGGRSRISTVDQLTGLTVRLAYYPPYHSKYNPIERCWGILENHWNG